MMARLKKAGCRIVNTKPPPGRSAAAMSARRRSTTGMSIKTMWATILSNRRLGQQRRAAVDAGDPGAGPAHPPGQPPAPAPKIKALKPLHGPQPAPQEPVSAPVKAVGPARIGGGGQVPQHKILPGARPPTNLPGP